MAKSDPPLTLSDRLSRLDHSLARRLIGTSGMALLPKAGAVEIDIARQVRFTPDHFQIVYPQLDDKGEPAEPVVVTLTLNAAFREGLQITCSHDGSAGLFHQAATISLLLEEKLALGLAAPPNSDTPWELVPEHELEKRALAEREERAAEEKMTIKAQDKSTPWTDYLVTSTTSGKSYRVALRGMERGRFYCACPDFRKNRLGTCKHVIKVQQYARKEFEPSDLKKAWKPQRIGIFARYDGDLALAVETPPRLSPQLQELLHPWEKKLAQTDQEIGELFEVVRQLSQMGVDYQVYPDAEEVINASVHRLRMATLVNEIRQSPIKHPLRTSLLHIELLPYQLDGIAFAAGAGRAVLADEMGLGKTIQGVGVAEFLARFAGVQRVLVVCPASLKSQWKAEIHRFCTRSVQIVAGKLSERTDQYSQGAFFTICNYEQVLKDYLDIERADWDLIILDEAQRIKNWEAKTSRIIKSLRSRFALVLTGTPLENRLDDLYSVVEFIDDRRLGPAYRFMNAHRTVNEYGRVLGYKNLDALRETLKPILLRRTRQSVALDLPSRTMEVVRITPTDEQRQLHNAHMSTVQSITSKPYITEMDLLRLQRALLMARMSADSTQLVDKEPPGFSSKLDRLAELLDSLIAEPQRKIILFSEWTSMLDLIEPILHRLQAKFVRLDGSVSQKKRAVLVDTFQTEKECRCFLTTNAGSTGLNLQAADTVINIDLPWNPALLEQRIARAHRMGQKRKVHVYLLISEGTIEENLLATLGAKHELASAVLDPDSNLSEVKLVSGMEELKRRLEVLLGAKPEAPPDESQQLREEGLIKANAERQAKLAQSGGQLVGAAFAFLGDLLPGAGPSAEVINAVQAGLQHCVKPNEDGTLQLHLTLPNADSLESMANALAKLMALTQGAKAP